MGPGLRVVFDTNVLVSGVLYRGRPHLCLRIAREGIVHSLTSEFILAEFSRTLIQRFAFEPERAKHATLMIRQFSDVVNPQNRITGVCRDPDDDNILACAVEGGADVIVTGDADLLELTPFDIEKAEGTRAQIQLLSPVQFLTSLNPVA